MKDLEFCKRVLEENRNTENAGPMEKYMKNLFPFLGIKSPERKKLAREIFQQTGLLKAPLNESFVLSLWSEPEREYQYVGLDYIERQLKKLNEEHIGFMEALITTKSWWDTVDLLASHAVGKIAEQSKEVIPEVIDGWAVHENMWLRRTAILFQLKYKESTDERLLYRYILENADSKEFFISKAIGWALREYSKTNPESVRRFILDNPLQPLSIREGSKYI